MEAQTPPPGATALDLDAPTRRRLWEEVTDVLEGHRNDIAHRRIAPDSPPERVRQRFDRLDALAPMTPDAALRFVAEGLSEDQLHAAHPRYFGLFVPAPSDIGVIADALASGFNPQLASWGHAPFGVEAEQWVVRTLGTRLGYPVGEIEGTITSGGSEANLTGLLAALYHTWPDALTEGLQAVPRRPSIYLSVDAHDSWRKAARVSGLGESSLRWVPCDDRPRMDIEALRRCLAEDRRCGWTPFLVIATVGSTASGGVDPLPAIADVARRQGLWLHADAAWAGAAALTTRHREAVIGLPLSDSLTLDPHKWLSSPMGAGVYLSRRVGALRSAFSTTPRYLPAGPSDDPVTEPYQESLQWSRRFNGLKILMTLITAGWAGIEDAIHGNFVLADRLRRLLPDRGWRVLNRTPLPVVCFRDGRGNDARCAEEIVAAVNRQGLSWVSLARMPDGTAAIRACVANHRTTRHDVDILLHELDTARESARGPTGAVRGGRE
ncbi:MAG: L-2,4-diaminobutyrate decarboxylase [Gemmatimonadota bacterium]